MKLAAYLRVSTDKQAEEGNGLDVQERMIRAWVKRNKHELVSLHTDAGLSGTLPAEDRPALAAVLAAVRAGEVDGVIVRDLDRLAREVTTQEAVLADLWRRPDVEVFAVTTGLVARDDPDDPMRTAMRQMMGVFAGLERRMLVKRMRDGRKAKAARGGHAVGRPAYGWRAEGSELVPVDAEQMILRRILRLHKAGNSTRAIAAALNADPAVGPTKAGAEWSSQVVSRILARPAARRRTPRAAVEAR